MPLVTINYATLVTHTSITIIGKRYYPLLATRFVAATAVAACDETERVVA